jgi:thiamine-phosphate diphosphorylase
MYAGGICFITDRKSSPFSLEEMTLMVIQSQILWIQYRDKERTRRELYENALSLRRITLDSHAVFIVNDHADIARAVDADGVHLGQEDLPLREARKIMGKNRIIGISTHSIEEAISAEKNGADYIGFGPVFHTTTKDAGTPKGIAMLHEIKQRIALPLVAIGGITLTNLPDVLDAGADAVAIASSLLRGNIRQNADRFASLVYSHHNNQEGTQ